MQIFKLILLLLLFIVALLILISYLNSRPVSRSEAYASIQKLVDHSVEKEASITGALIYVDSSSYNLSQSFISGDANANQSFHVASAGKAFVATLIGWYIDQGSITLDTKIIDYLPKDILSGQFTYEGTDYSEQVTIGHLLNHTSGAADYFDDPVTKGLTLKELVVNQPDKFWTPTDLLDFSAQNQNVYNSPGETYHYSDNNYILLGLLLEDLSGMAYDELLDEVIFSPLEMDDTYLLFYSEPKNPLTEIGDVYLNDTNIKDYQSLSIDWAGGGIISTPKDLSLFIRALNKGEIISTNTLEQLYSFDYKFTRGIHYGYGFMSYHFEEYFPGLGTLGQFKGHMGVLGTQMFYDLDSDTVYISNYGSTDASALSVQDMIKVVSLLKRTKD